MFLRALFAFLVLPGMAAFVLPIAFLATASRTRVEHPTGFVVLVGGVVGLLLCVRDFYVLGKGTLAPWAPPERLVVVGLYRFSRNPMYVSVVTIVAGWAWSFASPSLLAYAALLLVGFHLRVVMAEEPYLLRTHGEPWVIYRESVPRWLW
ncbi:MAG: isoprenylcysteine carboxylmethyltransferase family protein [Candidatus Binatia bacterium]